MNISLDKDEINIAITDYVGAQGVVTEGKQIKVVTKMKQNKGLTAEVTILDNEENVSEETNVFSE